MAKAKSRCPVKRKQWYEKPEGMLLFGFLGSLIAGVVVAVVTESIVNERFNVIDSRLK